MIEVGEGVGGKNPAPLNGKRSSDPGTLDPEVKTSRSETASANTRYTNGKRKGEAHGSHTLL